MTSDDTQEPQPEGTGGALRDTHALLRRARARVDELREVVISATRLGDDIAQITSQARCQSPDAGRDDLEAATEELARLQGRCTVASEIATALVDELDQAAVALARARELATDEHLEVMGVRLDALNDSIAVSRQVTGAAIDHLRFAEQISGDVAPAGLMNRGQIEHRLEATDRRLERVDEDVRLLDALIERAAEATQRSAANLDEAFAVGTVWSENSAPPRPRVPPADRPR